MTHKSKLIFFLLTGLILLSLTSCKKNKNDVIPDVYIDFTINLSDPDFFDLNAIGNTKIVTSSTNNWGTPAAGYGRYRGGTQETGGGKYPDSLATAP